MKKVICVLTCLAALCSGLFAGNYVKTDSTAFSGANESAKLYDKAGNESPLALIHQVKEEKDDDYAGYETLFEDLVYDFYERSMKELDFSNTLGEKRLEISASNAKQILSEKIQNRTNAYSTAIKFLCNYLLGNKKTDLEISLNERYTSVFDLKDLVFHIGEEGEEKGGNASVFTVGVEGNDGKVRDICLLGLKKDEEGNWSVTGLKSFCLLSLMINSILKG